MPIRITDSSLSSRLTSRIAINQRRLEAAQEKLSSGKRINRPSDDPFGAEAVLRFRTAQANIEQFQKNAATVKDSLLAADSVLDSYQRMLDRATALLTQGASDSSNATARSAIAQELEGIRTQMLTIANTRNNDRYLFGGTRQNVAPFDAMGTAAAGTTTMQLVQIEPDAAVTAAGVTAESIFSNSTTDVFATLESAITALRGTGDDVADRAAVLSAIDGLTGFSNQSEFGRAQLGASLQAVETANTRLEGQWLALQASTDRYELIDIAAVALELTQANNALQATLQATAFSNKGSLMDLIG
jgi:flagellar hook-associated protein 3 FlgL